MFQAKNPNLSLGLGAGVDGADDFNEMPDIRLGIGHHDGIACGIRHESGLSRHKNRKVLSELLRLDIADGNDLSYQLFVGGNLSRIIADLNRNISALGGRTLDNSESATVADGCIPVFIKNRVNQVNRLIPIDRLSTQDTNQALYFRF